MMKHTFVSYKSSLRFIPSDDGLLGGHIIGECRIKLLPPGHLGPLLHLVMGVLVCRAWAVTRPGCTSDPCTSIKLCQGVGISKSQRSSSRYSDELQLGHKLAVEATHGVPVVEAHALGLQVAVDPGELGKGLLALLRPSWSASAWTCCTHSRWCQPPLCPDKIVTSGMAFMMCLYFLILEGSQLRRQWGDWGGVESKLERVRWLQHVNSGDFQSNGL